MKQISYTLCTVVLLLALGTGCGQKPETAQPAENKPSQTEQGSQGTQQGTANGQTGQAGNSGQDTPSQPDRQTLKIKSYYSDDQLNDLTEKEQEIVFSGDDKYAAALETLKDSGEEGLFPLWKVDFLSAKLSDGLLTVDILLPDEARLGSGGEVLALEALERTLFQFAEIDAIELLVEGKQVESLMGHVELEHPITRK